MPEAGGDQAASSGKGTQEAAVVNALAECVTSQFLTHLAVPPGALTAAVLLLHRQRAGGVPLPLLRLHMGAMRRRVVQRGINILDGRVIAQDLEQGLDSASDAISVVVSTYVHTHTHTHTRSLARTHTHTQAHARTLAHIHTHTHTLRATRIYTHRTPQ